MSFTEAATTDSPADTFSQVVFIDIPYLYSLSTPINCSYILNAAFQPNGRDWVGIFKVGWSTTKEYHTFVWAESCLDVEVQDSKRQAVFKDYYLPKDEIDFYQFCYIDSTGQVRGASTPFCFRNRVEQSLSSLDDDLLVITTQKQHEQSVCENVKLQKELSQLTKENEDLNRALQEKKKEEASLMEQLERSIFENVQQQKVLSQLTDENEALNRALQEKKQEEASLKEQIEQMGKEKIQLVKDLEQQKESCHSKEMIAQQIQLLLEDLDDEQQEFSPNLGSGEASRQNEREKLDRAVLKIRQYHNELRGKVGALREENAMFHSKIREDDGKLSKYRDSMQLLQFELENSENAKEKLVSDLHRFQSRLLEMDNLKRENQELSRKHSQQNCPDEELKDLRVRCKTLSSQLQDAQAASAAGKEESKSNDRQARLMEGQLLQVRQQLKSMILSHEQTEDKCEKREMKLRVAHEVIADKDGLIEEKEHMIMLLGYEKEELAKENHNLTGEIEELHHVIANIHVAPPADSPQRHSDTTSTVCNTSPIHDWQPPMTPQQFENLYENTGSFADVQEEPLVCRHCLEQFPFMTRQELEEHEQSHRICPFCRMICDNIEQPVFESHVYGCEP